MVMPVGLEVGDDVSKTVLGKYEVLVPIIKVTNIGFGFERLLYQLNPSLCCQNSLLLPHYSYTLTDVLTTLNNLAAKHAKTSSLVDRHIAAFITNRLEVYRELRELFWAMAQ